MTVRAPLRPAALTSATAAGALLLTTAVALLPFGRFAYEAPGLHIVLETAEGCIALGVAYLLFGRYRRTGSSRSLLLSYALSVVAVANLGLQALPQAVGSETVTAWAPLAVRLLGVCLLTAAAVLPDGFGASVVAARSGLVACAVGVVVLIAGALLLGDRLPPTVDPSFDPSLSVTPVIEGHPLVLAAQVVSGLLYAVAAVAFTRHAARERDELQRWIGAGCALAAVARVNYLLYPSLYSDYVYVGDLLRLGFYLCLLVGAAREVRSFWEAQSYAAVLEDRRRLARDLHDGLTQELTYIWSQSRLLDRDDPVGDRINSAAARALDEARTAIAALTRPSGNSFGDVLGACVEGLSSRYGAAGSVRLTDGVGVSPAQAEGVLRITAEAFRNAVRHGGAASVDVSLTASPLLLSIRDDGAGFDRHAPATSNGSGFGLTSMRERAETLGACFTVDSQPGSGTTVEVRWP